MHNQTVPSFAPYDIQQAAIDACEKNTTMLAAATWLADSSSPDFVTKGEVKYNLEGTHYYVHFDDRFGEGVVTFSLGLSNDKVLQHVTWEIDQDG
ncbi:hypothetical protein MYOV003v1_p0111 [Vibrio phage 207E48.1]|nr:hypothetical protein MYOV003v1_p0111 [Vibrio phage 207E48.1]